MDREFDHWFKENYHQKLALSNRFVTMYLAIFSLLKNENQIIVETGTSRKDNNWLDGMSSLVFGSFCKKYGHHLFSVDINPAAMDVCRDVTRNFANVISYHVDDSVAFLKKFNQKINLLYLDSMDCPEADGETLPQLTASQEHQLNEIKAAFEKLSDDAIILLDDNDHLNGGKTRLTKNFLKKTEYREIISWKQSLWMRS